MAGALGAVGGGYLYVDGSEKAKGETRMFDNDYALAALEKARYGTGGATPSTIARLELTTETGTNTYCSVSGVVFGVVGGTNLGVATVGVAVAVCTGVLAFASWRHTRAITAARPASAHWWKLVLGGAGVFIATVVTVNVTGEVSSDWWLPMMLTFLIALTTSITGIILGIAHLTTTRTRHA